MVFWLSPLRFDILKEIEKKIPGFPIVLHGSSSVPQDLVAVINKYGGALKDAIGIPEDQLREAAKSAVCKINIDSDGRLAMTGRRSRGVGGRSLPSSIRANTSVRLATGCANFIKKLINVLRIGRVRWECGICNFR